MALTIRGKGTPTSIVVSGPSQAFEDLGYQSTAHCRALVWSTLDQVRRLCPSISEIVVAGRDGVEGWAYTFAQSEITARCIPYKIGSKWVPQDPDCSKCAEDRCKDHGRWTDKETKYNARDQALIAEQPDLVVLFSGGKRVDKFAKAAQEAGIPVIQVSADEPIPEPYASLA